ncbi:hypothetical protein ACFQU1_20385 [Chelatococcus sp. GCM10030263]|uniref:hypothetical protein n=1 Tax=Chelatococcus sp. GCM10030263 TaxID=3273387 RepID=UPI00360977EE
MDASQLHQSFQQMQSELQERRKERGRNSTESRIYLAAEQIADELLQIRYEMNLLRTIYQLQPKKS